MANSTASIFIKPTVAFKRGDTFVFGSWVCTADGAGSFQRRLTIPPNPETGLVTLPEVVTGNLTVKFGEISLYNQHADFELGSDSNSNSTSPWASHASRLPSHHVRPTHAVSASRVAPATSAGPTRRLAPRVGPARRSYPSTTRTPTPPPATTRTPTLSPASTRIPLTSSTSGRTLMSPSPRTTYQSNPCQDQPPAWL
jgi:hypothetical protein